jgi:hypothetical protein
MANEKRKSVDVNESLLRDMIEGKASNMEEISEGYTGGGDPVPASAPVEESPANETPDAVKSRKRRESKNYGGVFLAKRPAVPKRQTYISAALFTKISEIMAVVANDLTLPTFLDNVLEHHLETFKDEINELYDTKTKRPL